ncbi:MAG: prolyl oligopeptidase family serine peptidase, partial [Gemmatimonadota bacterium]
MNWFQGHTDRFRTIVNHDGLFDLRSMYFATEELWFPEWEFGGPPWEGSDAYDRWNPAASVEEWDTPMLIIHGARDYRVPLEQGHQRSGTTGSPSSRGWPPSPPSDGGTCRPGS